MEPDLLVFNGVDPVTGRYLRDPLSVDDLTRTIVTRLRRPEAWRRRVRVRGLIDRIDPRNLEQTGWGVIFGHDVPLKVRDALCPLLEYRRSQAARHKKDLYRVCEAKSGESAAEFLDRMEAAPGPVDPEVLPYYLLIVGGPDSVPFTFQYRLDVQYGVGRLWFERPEEYKAYAERVIQAEQAAPPVTREAVFFGPTHEKDGLTRLSSQELAGRLSEKLPGAARRGWTGQAFLGGDATKAQLAALLCKGKKAPSLLFTAGHGLGLRAGHSRQRLHQGALLCSEWPGPGSGTIQPGCFFAGHDLPEDADLGGLISFHFACYSAGTPRYDTFTPGQKREIAKAPFLADLPLSLLRQGALAVIGHIDQAWLYSFLWLHQKAQIGAFQSTLGQLMDGFPVGAAMEYFGQRYAEISTELTLVLNPGADRVQIDDVRLAKLWTANDDARSYAVLGDPAVRLAVPG